MNLECLLLPGAHAGRSRSTRLATSGAQPQCAIVTSFEELAHNAVEAAALERELMGMGHSLRLEAVRQEVRFQRLPLLVVLNETAMGAFFNPASTTRAGLEEAEVATVLASVLPSDNRGVVKRRGALAHWLLGKLRLRQGDLVGAEAAFLEIGAIVFESGAPVEESGLGLVGLAQVAQAAGDEEGAVRHFKTAALAFAEADLLLPTAACLAEAGLLQTTMGHHLPGRRNLHRAWRILEQMPADLSPATAARVALAAAECDARLRRPASGDGREWLERARRLYSLPTVPHEDVLRRWMEGRAAIGAERFDAAEALLRDVRERVLAEGSLAEAVAVSCDTLTVRYQARQALDAEGIATALEASFSEAGAPWATAIRDLAACALRFENSYPSVARETLRRLSASTPVVGRPDLLVPHQALTDRLLRHAGELEDPSGAAFEIAAEDGGHDEDYIGDD